MNNQIVKVLDLKLNEFGSVAGEITIPNNGLTGKFSITSKLKDFEHSNKMISNFDHNHYNFSVEEYKRPNFEVKFEDLEGEQRESKPVGLIIFWIVTMNVVFSFDSILMTKGSFIKTADKLSESGLKVAENKRFCLPLGNALNMRRISSSTTLISLPIKPCPRYSGLMYILCIHQ
mgnify:CR=1 FL=1